MPVGSNHFHIVDNLVLFQYRDMQLGKTKVNLRLSFYNIFVYKIKQVLDCPFLVNHKGNLYTKFSISPNNLALPDLAHSLKFPLMFNHPF